MTVQGIRARGIRGIAVLAVLVSVACTPMMRNHGFVPEAEDLSRIQIGVDTSESVRSLIGPPTAEGVLSDSGYYYVASKFRHFGALAPEEISRELVAITFTPTGVVENIERFGLEDGRVIVLSRRVTDSAVRDTTFIRQLLGAVGRVNAGDILGEP